MKVFLASIIVSFGAHGLLCQKLEDGWNGIEVFKTSRIEVEKKLGSPRKTVDDWYYYKTDKAQVRMLFSTGSCISPGTLLGGFNVPSGIVLEYVVSPKKTIPLEKLNWDRGSYEREPDKHNFRLVTYQNLDRGISVHAGTPNTEGSEVIDSITFGRLRSKVAQFECPGS